MDDNTAMARALALGERGRRTSAPNPWVGCVIVSGGEIIGEGFHSHAGEDHAEVQALRVAGGRAMGATAYVTLEPCDHYGRTPPCSKALLEAGIRRVVVAMTDPDPRVAGRGIARLRSADTLVETGVLEKEAARSLAAYLHHRRTRRAYCILKAGVSMDGRTAAADGTSQWITGSAARADAHQLRAESQAVVVGAGTATADRPSLTARDVKPPVERQPLRVLLDARGRVPAEGPLFDRATARTLVVTTSAAEPRAVAAWRAAEAEVARVPAGADGDVDLSAALTVLGERGVLQALVEGGSHVHGSLVRERLADAAVLYMGACNLGEAGQPLFGGPGPATIADAPRWNLTSVLQLGNDVRLWYEPVRPARMS